MGQAASRQWPVWVCAVRSSDTTESDSFATGSDAALEALIGHRIAVERRVEGSRRTTSMNPELLYSVREFDDTT
jgi:hypothetical protein